MELRALKAFYTANEGLVTLTDDVLSIVSQVRELYGDKIKICLEPTVGKFIFSELCEDGTERLIFIADELDPRCIERLLMADSQVRGYEDPYDKAEREQDQMMEEKDQAAVERMKDAGERLAWAMEEDGRGTHAQILVTKNVNAYK